ncbi:glycolate oxidase subunit GlcE [Herbaspirillum sp. BH-1]|uniref:Glycolate oxidase FAD binding subunit n=1 Tax=Herbaspirillum frisingense TaxID=92645 RepID=A0ABU1PAS2_9BURK|nr:MULTISPECIES: glycolate oxidase subunit GlcE [Herbaspirillum]MDR6582934.1 glycolate oxidase FAD binding subunit [Herbaspirillum frisingense]PLY60486.1 glycolate oxidase subunit GlcE [Herbaspirillum sp. BH-1]
MSNQDNNPHVLAHNEEEAAHWLAATRRRIRAASEESDRLVIEGSGSRQDFAGQPEGERLSLRAYRGIVRYEPDDLVITVRAGTPVTEVQQLLDQHGQMLGFEPPLRHGSTVGGAVALGWSGPRRPFAGALRDHLLGVRMLDGEGRLLRFGGEVVKNVAGFDVARLMAGSLGILGPVLEVSLRVLPRPSVELSAALPATPAQALSLMQGLPTGPGLLTATAYLEDRLYLRSAGSLACVQAFLERQGGQLMEPAVAHAFWSAFSDQTHACFAPPADGLRLWRISLRPGAPAVPSDLATTCAIDWAGALRWAWAPANAAVGIIGWARAHGGHATLWAHASAEERQGGVFQALPAPVMRLHQRLKQVFDPRGVFNVGRMYPQF